MSLRDCTSREVEREPCMSIKLMSQAWEKKLSGNNQLVALVLADYANDDGVCWPSLQVVAWKVGCNERTVRRAIEALVGMGAITKQRRFQKSAVYTLDFSNIPDKAGKPSVDILSSLADLDAARVDNSAPRVDTALSAKSGHSSVHLTTIEPPREEPPKVETPIIPTEAKPDKSDIPVRRQQFLDLWAAYPKGRKVGKEVCYREFLKQTKTQDDVDDLMFALDVFKQSNQWMQEDGRYIPGLGRFLKERRWEDIDPNDLPDAKPTDGYTRLLEVAMGGDD